MTTHFIRIESTNIDSSVLDTQDLSTRRGGSLMMLEAIQMISSKFEDQLSNTSTGASIGLFARKNASDVKKLKSDIEIALTQNSLGIPSKHGSFVVTTVDLKNAEKDFSPAVETAITATRWAQMQRLSFSKADLNAHPIKSDAKGELTDNNICDYDKKRGATQSMDKGRDESKATLRLSQSVYDRRLFGRKRKFDFHHRLLDGQLEAFTPENFQFVNDLSDLSQASTTDLQSWSANTNLNHKIAVFYADGNKFGKVGQDCKSADALRDWDTYIQGVRKKLMHNILIAAIADAESIATECSRWINRDPLADPDLPGSKKPTHGHIRLETPLWGGDELMFIVPAWCGFEIAQQFFNSTKAMEWADEKGVITPLTHACGLVFCHHNAPIHRIQNLARSLADKGKERMTGRGENMLNWMVLESFDHAGAGLDEYLKERFQAPPSWKQLERTPTQINSLISHLPHLKDALPRSQITRIVRLMANNEWQTDENPYTNAYQRVHDGATVGKVLDVWQTLWHALCPKDEQALVWGMEPPLVTQTNLSLHLPIWYTLIELWDYVIEIKPTEEGQTKTQKQKTGDQT